MPEEDRQRVVRKPEPQGGMDRRFRPLPGKVWSQTLGQWVDPGRNRQQRRQAERLAQRRLRSHAKAEREIHVPSAPGESQMGVTRRPTTARLSTPEFLRHRQRDPDAVRRARFRLQDPDREPTEEVDLVTTPSVGKSDALLRQMVGLEGE
jgi:hypothetical protein